MAIKLRKNLFHLTLLSISLGFCLSSPALAQGTVYNYFYRVYFRDKGNTNYLSTPASQLLSPRAIARRTRAEIAVPVYNDIPVYDQYIHAVVLDGFTLHCTSRWMNTGLFKTVNEADIAPLLALPFVKEVKVVKRPAGKGRSVDKLAFETSQSTSPTFDNPMIQLKGNVLHNSGFTGDGILIAVLDGGFSLADKITSLEHLRQRSGIIATKDIVSGNGSVYGYHYHGTAVMSVLAGMEDFEIEGSAPDADYCLLRTEDTATEYPVEEDFWAAGAEFADSIGADIISSSLGYYMFDDHSMDYTFADMDGKTTFVTRAADIAASKGILVVTSAGNERSDIWVRIIAPTDGDSVLSAGAVDGDGLISSFSSAGPSADGRIKPDNVAQGVSVPVQIEASGFARASGTSFSCPLLSGVCACVMQAVPGALNTDIITTMHENGNRYQAPDSLYGYGLPDMVKVVEALQNKFISKPEVFAKMGPNPFTDKISILFRDNPGSLDISICTISGREIYKKSYSDYISRSVEINELANSNPGLYILRLRTSGSILTYKLIKVRK